ncbi:MAG: toxin TcdB middle/N-terminal domain-containing protein [Planctomycetota bacterium]
MSRWLSNGRCEVALRQSLIGCRRALAGVLLSLGIGSRAGAAAAGDPVNVDPFFGAPSVAYPIEVAPGTRGMQPQLALTYRPGLGEQGLGWDWTMSGLDYIELSTRQGVPRYDGTDALELSGEQLVTDPDGSVHTRIESHLRIDQVGFGDTHWIVRQKDGKALTFGHADDDSSEIRLPGSTATFRWNLDEVVDPIGNSVRFAYDDLDDPGVLYPASITYTYHDGVLIGGARSVEFEWENRPDVWSTFGAGFEQSYRHRLKAIHVKVGGALVRRYQLTYDQDPTNGRSRLVRIAQLGSDGVQSLPATEFLYHDEVLGFDVAVAWPNVQGQGDTGPNWNAIAAGSGPMYVEMLDLDRDGRPDRIMRGRNNFIDWVWQRNNGSGFDDARPLPGAWSPQPGSDFWDTFRAGGAGLNVELADLDGDLLPDRILRGFQSPYLPWTVQWGGGGSLSPPVGWAAETPVSNDTWTAPRAYQSDGTQLTTHVDLRDLNGDGRADRLWIGPGQPHTSWRVQWNAGGAFQPSVPWPGAWSYNNSFEWSGIEATYLIDGGHDFIVLTDMNGDGLADRVLRNYQQPYGAWTVQYNTGRGFLTTTTGAIDLRPFPGVCAPDCGPSPPAEWVSPAYHPGGTGNADLIDMNGDGLPDRVMRPYSPPFNQWLVQFNTGAGFLPPRAWPGVENQGDGSVEWNALYAGGDSVYVRLIDMDGDGLVDRVMRRHDPPYDRFIVQRNRSRPTHLLREVRMPTGARVALEYRPAAWFDNTGADQLSDLAAAIPVVVRKSVDDGLGHTDVWTYAYRDGLFDAASHEFRGFAHVDVVDPGAARTSTTYLQDDVFKGRQAVSERFDAGGNLLRQTTNSWSFTRPFGGVALYDVRLDATEERDFDGNANSRKRRTEFTYDAHGNVTSRREQGDPDIADDDIEHRFTYLIDEQRWIVELPTLKEVRDAQGNVVSATAYAYDAAGQLLEQVELGPENPTTEFSYDAWGNLTSACDPLGSCTTITYDAVYHTFAATLTNALGHVQTTSYDPGHGQLLWSQDANGVPTSHVYDVFGRITETYGPEDPPGLPLVRVSYQDATVPNRVRTELRQVHGSTLASDLLIADSYRDGLGREVQLREPTASPSQQTVTDFALDFEGRPVRQSQPYESSWSDAYQPPTWTAYRSTTYDALDRTLVVEHADGARVEHAYDDWRTTTTDENGHVTMSESDAHGRTIKVYEGGAGGPLTLYQYDAAGRLTRVVDAHANEWQFEYDAFGRKVRSIDPDLGAWTFAYDAAGDLIRRVDARGNAITFAYDALNRLVSKALPGGATVDYSYDHYPEGGGGGYAIGRRTRVRDGSGSTTFRYDHAGNVVGEDKDVAGHGVFTIAKTYDALGKIRSVTYPLGDTVVYDYDAAGRVARIHGPTLLTLYVDAITYTATNQIQEIRFGNGVETVLAYDPLTARRTGVRTTNTAANVLQDLAYSYDAKGNVTLIQDLRSVPVRETQSFTYDHLDRLTRAVADGYGDLVLGYDEVGNLTRYGAETFTYGGAGAPVHGVVASDRGFAARYDANGNMIGARSSRYTYDAENRLVRVSPELVGAAHLSGAGSGLRAGSVAFTYDGDGGRVLKQPHGGPPTIYVGSLFEQTGKTSRKYIFLGDQRIVTRTSQPGGSTLRFHHADHLNSMNVVTDEAGSEVDRGWYRPYGGDAATGSQHATPYLFTGHEWDAESRLYFMEMRYYDPSLGRFISPDVVVHDPQDPQTLNRFAYARNNPVRYADPTGADFWDVVKDIVEAVPDIARFARQTEKHFSRPLVHNPKRFLREHRAQIRSALTSGGVAVATSIFTGGTSLVVYAASAAGASLVLDTPAGQDAVQGLASGLQKGLGLSPKISYIAAGAILGSVAQAGLTWGINQAVGSSAAAASVEVTTPKDVPKPFEISRQGILFNHEVNVERIVSPMVASLPPALQGIGQSLVGKIAGKLPSIVITARLNWVHVATAATYGHKGYRLGQRTSDAARNDASLWDQLGKDWGRRDD